MATEPVTAATLAREYTPSGAVPPEAFTIPMPPHGAGIAWIVRELHALERKNQRLEQQVATLTAQNGA